MNFLLNISSKIVRLLAWQGDQFQQAGDGGGPTPSKPGVDLSYNSNAEGQYKAVSDEVNKILNEWVGPLFIALGGIGGIYIIILAINYIRSENDSKRSEAKQRMINCAIGVICLLVLGALALTVDWGSLVKIFGYTAKESCIGLLK
jgi:hypothetical protein